MPLLKTSRAMAPLSFLCGVVGLWVASHSQRNTALGVTLADASACADVALTRAVMTPITYAVDGPKDRMRIFRDARKRMSEVNEKTARKGFADMRKYWDAITSVDIDNIAAKPYYQKWGESHMQNPLTGIEREVRDLLQYNRNIAPKYASSENRLFAR